MSAETSFRKTEVCETALVRRGILLQIINNFVQVLLFRLFVPHVGVEMVQGKFNDGGAVYHPFVHDSFDGIAHHSCGAETDDFWHKFSEYVVIRKRGQRML